MLHAGRVAERSEAVEYGRAIDAPPRLSESRRERMKLGCEHKTDAHLGESLLSDGRWGINIDPEQGNCVRAAGRACRRTVAVLSHRNSGPGDHKGRCRGYVKR